MNLFVVGPQELEAIGRVRALAEQNPIPWAMLQAVALGMVPADYLEGQRVNIPLDLTVYFSVEVQPQGPLRHLSASVSRPGHLPNPAVIGELLPLFGFRGPLGSCIVWPADCGGGRQAVNVVEPLDGDWTPFQKVEHQP